MKGSAMSVTTPTNTCTTKMLTPGMKVVTRSKCGSLHRFVLEEDGCPETMEELMKAVRETLPDVRTILARIK
jgi:hypothetical protein